MELFFRQIFQELLFFILKLIDGICRVFGILIGLDNLSYQSGKDTLESSSLLDFFLEQDPFVTIFLTLFVVSVLVLVVCMVFAVFRTMFSNKADGETKSHTKIIGDGMRSLLTTCLVFIITVTGIGSANLLLKTVHKAVNGNNPTSITRVVLELGLTDNGTTIDYVTSEVIKDYQLAVDQANWDIPSDKVGSLPLDMNTKEAVEEILEKKGEIWDEENGTWNWLKTKDKPLDIQQQKDDIKELFDENGYLKSDLTAVKIWGTYKTNFVNLPNGAWDSENATIDGSSYEALMPYLAAFILLYVLCMTCFTLVKRAFDIIVLLFVLPFVNATVPLDDGAHMKLWRETMISKILLAFGAVVAIAVFNLLAPMINDIVVMKPDGKDVDSVLTSVIRFVVLVGGGLSISGGMTLISRLVGTGIAEGSDMAATARTLLAGGAGALGAGIAAVRLGKSVGGNLLFGKEKRNREGGVLQASGTLLSASAKALGGNAYTGYRRRTGEKLANAITKTKGVIMGNNGLIGGGTKAAKKAVNHFRKK